MPDSPLANPYRLLTVFALPLINSSVGPMGLLSTEPNYLSWVGPTLKCSGGNAKSANKPGGFAGGESGICDVKIALPILDKAHSKRYHYTKHKPAVDINGSLGVLTYISLSHIPFRWHLSNLGQSAKRTLEIMNRVLGSRTIANYRFSPHA